jgi:hypothetical protein
VELYQHFKQHYQAPPGIEQAIKDSHLHNHFLPMNHDFIFQLR